MKNSPYFEQVVLMLRAIPHLTAESCFALKGGTAINLFVRDMPRLSVDIDLAYLPVDEPRETALHKMSSALARVAAAVKKAIKEGELDRDSVCANFAHTAEDGKTYSVQHFKSEFSDIQKNAIFFLGQ